MLLATSTAAAEAPHCTPTARITGDPDAAKAIAHQLAVRGIGHPEQTANRCPPVQVWVQRDGNSLTVAVRDPAGRAEQRIVTTGEIAATWIESWMSTEPVQPLLAVHQLPPMPANATAAAPPTETIAATTTSAGPAWYRKLSFGTAIEDSTADDATKWRSFTAAGCIQAGDLCIGASARYGSQNDYTRNGSFTLADRTTIDASLEGSLHVRAGHVTLVPTVRAGYSLYRAVFQEPLQAGPGGDPGLEPPIPPEGCLPDEPFDPVTCQQYPPFVSGSSRSVTVGAGLSALLPVTELISVELGASIEWAPDAHSQAYMPPWSEQAGLNVTDPYDQELFGLPGAPTRFVRVGIGLRFGER